MVTAILGLAVFSVIVIVHEFGHLLAARWVGVNVNRFSVGFGPVLASKTIRGIQFALSAFPLGGYVRMAGDDPRDRNALKAGDFFAAAWWRRVIIALGGPVANFIFALVLGIVLAWVGVNIPDAPNRVGEVAEGGRAQALGFESGNVITGVGDAPISTRMEFMLAMEASSEDPVPVQVAANGYQNSILVPKSEVEAVLQELTFPLPAEVGKVVPGFPAYFAGLQDGDVITAVDGAPIRTWAELTKAIHGSPDQELELSVTRGNDAFSVAVVPKSQERGEETIGLIGIEPGGSEQFVLQYPLGSGVVEGTKATLRTVALTYSGIWNLVTNFKSNVGGISGPVAIIQASGNAAKEGLDRLINLAVVLNVALMVFNLLPVPILDGGMVMMSVIEGLRNRPLGNRGLALYQGVGLAVIGTLLVFVLINDPLQMVKRQQAVGRVSETAP